MNETNEKIEFRGHWTVSLLTVGFFLLFCILFFIILQSFEMHALAMGGFVSLLLSSLFVKKGFSETYWEAVYDGVKEAVPVMMLLLIIGMFAEMIKISNLSIGFFWIAANLNVSPALFTALTFLFVALISSATGSSIGTMFTCFPIFYAAGVLLGSHPAALAGAIVSGGIFGDNLAPISDTTIISSSTQEYAHRKGVADIGGSVRARFKYSIIAGICSFILFYLLGGRSEAHVLMNDLSMEGMSPNSLLMLIPVFMMLFVSMKKQNMYLAITVGLISGIVVGLLSNNLTMGNIMSVNDGVPSGFLIDGVGNMMGTAVLVMSVYGIMGVLNRAGILDRLIETIAASKLSETARGTEIVMMIGITLTTLLFGGVTSASLVTFGKIQNELGKRANLHPYRRAYLLDGFANGLAVTVPFLSVFIFIGTQLTAGYDNVPQVSVTELSSYMFQSYFLFLVLLISVLTGLGRRFEGENGEPIKSTHPQTVS